jgi:glyoxylase-like metal-dependent hydrolase (beta-lactamase superfamily II)
MLNVTHIVNSIFTSRTYILTDDGKKDFWIVDCGDVPPLVDLISKIGGDSLNIKGVLLTHVHYDHIYGLPRLKEMFPDIRVYTNEAGRKALPNPKLNMSKYHDDPIIYETENVVTCSEGDVIDLFDGVQAKVHETLEHHPSCLTFEIGDYLFTGDAYIPGEKVVTILPGADKALAAESLERIKRMAEGKVVCPGHET